MEQEKSMTEETSVTERDTANDFSSGPLAAAEDTDEDTDKDLADDDDELLDDEAEEDL